MSLPISFEFFPTKTPEGAARQKEVRQALYAKKPEFCAVTVGAGGSTQAGTFKMVEEILSEGVSAASHFSCVGATKASVREQLTTLQAMGVKRLVALRGDLPSGYGAGGEFQYASDLVTYIRAEFGNAFHIEVAAYPEVHPQARSVESDLKAFATKVQAGADSAITQYFFNSDAYFRFVEDADKLGITVPIIPGLKPITNKKQLTILPRIFHVDIPTDLSNAINKCKTDAECEQVGTEWLIQQSKELKAAGVPVLHYYTLGKPKVIREVCKQIF